MNNEDLAITALIGSYDGSELEGLEPLKEGEDFFFPAIECAKRLGYHNPRDAIRRHCKRETKTVDEIVVTGNRLTSKPEGRQRRRAGVSTAQFLRRNTSARRTSTGCCSIPGQHSGSSLPTG